MQTKSCLKILLLCANFENKLAEGPIAVEHLKCCDWSLEELNSQR